MLRKLITKEIVKNVEKAPNSDFLEIVSVRGWKVVNRAGEAKVNDEILYFEVDSALPMDDERFAFLSERGVKSIRSDDGVTKEFHVLKTARLRGTYSQGLILPLSAFPELDYTQVDLAGQLGVFKYEPPLPAGAHAVGKFPSHLRTTDAERVQNIPVEVYKKITAETDAWVATEKIDGSSVTMWKDETGKIHVASRGWEIDLNRDSIYRKALDVSNAAHLLQPGEAVQGEVAGVGIAKNPLDLQGVQFFAFNFTRGSNAVAQPVELWPQWVKKLSVPVYENLRLPDTIVEAVEQIDGIKSLVSPGRLTEGVVWTNKQGAAMWELETRHVFKVISNKYLVKTGG